MPTAMTATPKNMRTDTPCLVPLSVNDRGDYREIAPALQPVHAACDWLAFLHTVLLDKRLIQF
jgi:hypothetical protein